MLRGFEEMKLNEPVRQVFYVFVFFKSELIRIAESEARKTIFCPTPDLKVCFFPGGTLI